MLIINGLQNKIIQAKFLSNPSELPFNQQKDNVSIDLPESPPDTINTVLKVVIDGTPRILPPLVRAGEKGAFILSFTDAVLYGKAAKRFNRKGRYYLGNCYSAADSVSWYLEIDKPGVYAVSVRYSTIPGKTGNLFTVTMEGKKLEALTEDTGEAFSFGEFNIGQVSLDGPGVSHLTVYPSPEENQEIVYIKEMKLLPADICDEIPIR